MEMINQFIVWLQAALESCLPLDFGILDFIQQYCTSPVMDKIMAIVTLFGESGIFWIALGCIFIIFPRTRKMGCTMGVALVMGVLVCNVWLKPAVARCRPFLDMMVDKHDATHVVTGWFSQFKHPAAVSLERIKEVWNLNIAGFTYSLEPDDFSFPSGHTIASIEACTAMMMRDKRWGIPACILAVGVSFSRLYLYIHYPTDVLTSIVLGVLFGIIAAGLVNLFWLLLPKGGSAGKKRSGGGGRFLAK